MRRWEDNIKMVFIKREEGGSALDSSDFFF
jgi:hypothetical protein